MNIAIKSIDVESIRQDFPVLKRHVHGKPLIYFDSAATSQKPKVMIERMTELYSNQYARVEEGHFLSREATKYYEDTRKHLASFINSALPQEVIFCRGATEALNILARSFANELLQEGDEILLTEAEHHSNIIPWILACKTSGAVIKVVPMNENGDIDLEQFESMITPQTVVASLVHMSNVTGIVYPVKQMTEIAHANGVTVIIDGAQAVPHIPVDVRDIDCDYYAGSGHKMGGPSSVGFLYGKADQLDSLPVSEGGSTMAKEASFDDFETKPIPLKFEAGEPAFGEVIPFGPAVDYWQKIGIDQIAAYEKQLTTYAREGLSKIPGVRILGNSAHATAIISFVVDKLKASDVEQALDREGIAVRSGNLASCPQLKAFNTNEAVRASFMFYNTFEEVDTFVNAMKLIASSAA
jgi:cysteine desulfurase / selenocysteine lyase